jgi:hypothetical protein
MFGALQADDDGEHGRHREEELGVAPNSPNSRSFREEDEADVVVQFPRSGELEVDPSSGATSRFCRGEKPVSREEEEHALVVVVVPGSISWTRKTVAVTRRRFRAWLILGVAGAAAR